MIKSITVKHLVKAVQIHTRRKRSANWQRPKMTFSQEFQENPWHELGGPRWVAMGRPQCKSNGSPQYECTVENEHKVKRRLLHFGYLLTCTYLWFFKDKLKSHMGFMDG